MRPIRASSATSRSRPPRGAPRTSGVRMPGHRPAAERPISVPSSSVKSTASSVTGRSRSASLTVRSDLERTEDAEGAVVAAAAANGVEVRAEHQRAAPRVPSRQDDRVVDGGVGSGLEPGRASALEEPRARGEVRLREGRARRHRRPVVAPNAASASKSARMRSASTRSTIDGDATATRTLVAGHYPC